MGNEYFLTPDGELYHWGIKGQKWGRRLYQNKDGSLTPLGKKRYAKEEAALKAREKTIKNREREAAKRAKLDAKKAALDAREKALNGENGENGKGADGRLKSDAKPKKKSLSEMSDAEINEAIERARLEDTYRGLRPEPVAKPGLVKEILTDVVKPAAMNSGKKFIEAALDKVAKDVLKDKVEPGSLEAIEAANKKLRAKIENDLLKKGIDPNMKGENLEKWKKFKDSLKEDKEAAKQANKDAKQDKKDAKQDEADTNKDAKESTEQNKAEGMDALSASIAKAEYDAFKESLINARKAAKQDVADRKSKEMQDAYKDRKEAAREEAAQIRAEKDRKARDYQDDYYKRKEAAEEYIYKKYTSMVPYSPSNSTNNATRENGEKYAESFYKDYVVIIDRDGSEIIVRRDDD